MRLMFVAALAGAAAAALLSPAPAHACGGLFCNAPPPDPFAPLPVAQNGENVVFSITTDPAGGASTLVAYIQILYTGDAAKFSWVVPVAAVPTLSAGTDRLFSSLAGVTAPRFQPTYATSGTCIAPPYPTYDGGVYPGTGGASAGAGGAAGADAGTVTVAFQGAVGPFDTAVIQSDDPTALKTWLGDNGYTVSDAASAIIDAYVREQKYFVALKLLNGVGVRAIQPIVMTFKGTDACVPLRLTAIAANPDMPVLVWVLGDKRVVPKGFYEIKIDEARIDWWNAGASYFGPKGLVSQAADEAGGNAFVAEYAGPSAVARSTVYSNGQFDLTRLTNAATPPAYVQQVIAMGLANDPLTLGLLAKYIPMPDAVAAMGVTDSMFYGNLSLYWNQYAFPAYDLAGLTNAISTSIVMPRMTAQMMIDSHPYLTRLNTFISPEEMNQDAFFFENQDLPDVSNVHTATIRTLCGEQEYMACNAPVRVELADGRMIWVRGGSTAATCQYAPYDSAGVAALPAADSAWQRDTEGEGMRVLDNAAAIQAGIVRNNARYPAEEARFPTPTSGVTTMTGTGGGAAGSTGSGGADGGMGGVIVPDHTVKTAGCGCDVGGGVGRFSALAALALAAMALVARRRRS